jgi:nitrate/nitrite transport system permease protein
MTAVLKPKSFDLAVGQPPTLSSTPSQKGGPQTDRPQTDRPQMDRSKPVVMALAEAEKVIKLPTLKAPSVSSKLFSAVKTAVGNVLPVLIVIVVLLALWQGLLSSPEAQFPTPTDVWADSKQLILDPFFDNGGTDKGLFWHISSSLSRVAVGFSVAAVLGVIIGVLLGAISWLHKGFDPIVQVLRTVPPLAWLPISLALFQQAGPSALFVIVVTAIWPIIINTAIGVRNIPADYVNVGRVLSLSPFEYFAKILLPASLPYIFAGLRIAIGMSWLAIVASEMLLGGVGIGFFIWDQYNASRISDILVGLLWVGLVGYMLDRIVAFAGTLISRGTLQN